MQQRREEALQKDLQEKSQARLEQLKHFSRGYVPSPLPSLLLLIEAVCLYACLSVQEPADDLRAPQEDQR
jgi:hypothetical protein